MRPSLVDVLNETFGTTVFDWLVPYPALVYAVAMLACLLVFARRCRQAGLDPQHAHGAAVAAMIGGLIGARLLFVICNPDRSASVLDALLKVSGSTVSWGAYGGGLIGFAGYLLWRRQLLLPYLDGLASVMGLGPFLGRWACYLNGCDFGRPTSLPWGIEYPHGSLAFVEQVRQGLIDPLARHSLAVHPVPIILSLNGLVLFLAFTAIWRSGRLAPGRLFFLFWVVFAFSRFWLDFLRGSHRVLNLGILSDGQVMALVVLVIAAGAVVALDHRQANPGYLGPSADPGLRLERTRRTRRAMRSTDGKAPPTRGAGSGVSPGPKKPHPAPRPR